MIRFIVLLVFCLASVLPNGRAQTDGSSPDVLIGPVVGYSFGSPSIIDRREGIINAFGSNGAGTSQDNFFSGGAMLELTRVFGGHVGLSSSIAYGLGSAEFLSDPFQVLESVGSEQFRILARYQLLDLSSHVVLDISPTIFLGAGAFLNYRTSSNLLQRLELLPPTNLTLPNGSLIDTVTTNNLATQLMHVGIPFEVGARIPLTKGLVLQGALTARCDLTLAYQGYFRQSWTWGIGISALLDASPEAPAPDVFIATVKLRTNGNSDSKSVTMLARDTLFRRFLPLPTILSSSVCSLLLAYSQAQESNPFISAGALDRKSPEECVGRLLDIIGSRAGDMERDTLGISFGSDTLAATAAQMIGSYLHHKWNMRNVQISRRRTDRPEGKILLSSTQLLSPLVNEWTERCYSSSDLNVEKVMYSSKGIYDWRLHITQGGHDLANYSNDSSNKSDVIPILTDTSRLEEVIATLSVKDSVGNSRSASDTLSIKVAGRPSVVEVNDYYLDPDSVSRVGSWDSHLLVRALGSIGPESRVELRPLCQGVANKLESLGGILLEHLKKSTHYSHQIALIRSPLSATANSELGTLTNRLFRLRVVGR